MKLRNKKTGRIREDSDLGTMLIRYGMPVYDSIAELSEDWEDYNPDEPLIKDEKIRKAVRAWADYHKIKEVKCSLGTWDHGGICLYDSVLQLYSIRDRVVIQFFMDAIKREEIDEGTYTIAELCGEEEDASV